MNIKVISLGGSIIIPDKVNFKFLDKFKRLVENHSDKYRFVIVAGGGSIARRYISALRSENKDKKSIALAGIRATRMNAMFLMQFFGRNLSNDVLPRNMTEVRNNLHKNKVVICGALRFSDNSTSDGTASKLARYLKSDFINLTNVPGLYTSDPKTNRNAKIITKISWKDFNRMAQKIKFKPGQHFVLDQSAAAIIKKDRIKTYILGPNIREVDSLLKNKRFVGTEISG